MTTSNLDRMTWWVAEPELFRREVKAANFAFPELEWSGEGSGSLVGNLPPWPFNRPAPEDLNVLLGDSPFRVRVQYGHAFPAVPPSVFPLAPSPDVQLRSFTDFHILGDGSLCLLREAEQWNTLSKTTDLILKAAGWRIEYALFEHGFLPKLTENGIVIDATLDPLIVKSIQEIKHDS